MTDIETTWTSSERLAEMMAGSLEESRLATEIMVYRAVIHRLLGESKEMGIRYRALGFLQMINGCEEVLKGLSFDGLPGLVKALGEINQTGLEGLEEKENDE